MAKIFKITRELTDQTEKKIRLTSSVRFKILKTDREIWVENFINKLKSTGFIEKQTKK